MAVRCPNHARVIYSIGSLRLADGAPREIVGLDQKRGRVRQAAGRSAEDRPAAGFPARADPHETHETHETHAIDSRTRPQDISRDDHPDVIESLPERQASVARASPISIEPASRASEPASRTGEPEGSPSQEEIDRRRSLVRGFFNDYWTSIDDKPASFAERLDRAEAYINERVAAGGENWRLEPATRKQLGLPPSRKK